MRHAIVPNGYYYKIQIVQKKVPLDRNTHSLEFYALNIQVEPTFLRNLTKITDVRILTQTTILY